MRLQIGDSRESLPGRFIRANLKSSGQGARIDRGAELQIGVIEEYIYVPTVRSRRGLADSPGVMRLAAALPCQYAPRPCRNLTRRVTADVEPARSMQPDVNPIGGHILRCREAAGDIRDDQRDLVFV